jgi:geranylgeranyl diphosphate synthase type II
LLKAIEYSLHSGGKRLRPVLFLSAYELACQNNTNNNIRIRDNAVLAMACALEMIHTYSLIHDDLPAMDNDDYRRGIPTNHKVFGEAMAILAGDGLLNLAYEVMLEHIPKESELLFRYVKALLIIARSAGISGMISGQSADIENQGKPLCEDTLHYIHTHKTEALITASLQAGALLGHDSPELFNAVTGYGKALGLAFQITDDILDITGDIAQLGKNTGKDEKLGKQTYPARYGLERSKNLARKYIYQAVSYIDVFGVKAEFLKVLALNILNRKH